MIIAPAFISVREARYLDRATLLVTHYDNRADPSAGIEGTYEYGWNTRFNAAGLRVELGTGWTAIVQWLDGHDRHRSRTDDFYSWPFYAQVRAALAAVGPPHAQRAL